MRLGSGRPDPIPTEMEDEVRESIPRYMEVAEGGADAQFLLASSIEVDRPRDVEDGWEIHGEAIGELRDRLMGDWARGRVGGREVGVDFSLLDLKVWLAERLSEECSLCEWSCGVNRPGGERGVCGVGPTPKVASAFIHMGEEPPISPSGTIFFSGCNFRCVFCQNWDISQSPDSGVETPAREIASIAGRLRAAGARNVNLVGGEPTPNIPSILRALRSIRVGVPVVWNSNMYMSERATELLLGVVDLWLPDFKYWDDGHALRYSGVPRYREVVSRNISAAYRFWPEMVVRHLVMPGHVRCCTVPILRWLAENTPGALVNVMGQYRPEYRAGGYPEIARRPDPEEMLAAYSTAEELGLRWRSVS